MILKNVNTCIFFLCTGIYVKPIDRIVLGNKHYNTILRRCRKGEMHPADRVTGTILNFLAASKLSDRNLAIPLDKFSRDYFFDEVNQVMSSVTF